MFAKQNWDLRYRDLGELKRNMSHIVILIVEDVFALKTTGVNKQNRILSASLVYYTVFSVRLNKSVKPSFPTSSAFYYLYFSPSWKIYILCIKAAISIPNRFHFPRLYLWQSNLHFPQIYFYTLKNPDTLREHYRIIICYGNSGSKVLPLHF